MTLLRNGLVALALSVQMAWAEAPILSAPEAEARIANGELVVLDIRSRGEWKDTGIAKGAWPVSMHERDFGQRLQAILAAYPTEQIALICATGGRTAHVLDVLERNGIKGISDISESMMGNARGPGWIKRGLEIVSLDEAQKAYDAAQTGWTQ